MKYTIYTDGAYSRQHDEGAFAYVIFNYENAEIEGALEACKANGFNTSIIQMTIDQLRA